MYKFVLFKDLDFVEQGGRINVNNNFKRLFIAQLRHDVEFLKRLNVMDYSLVLGVHEINKEEFNAEHGHAKYPTHTQEVFL